MTKLNLTSEQQASVDGTISFILNSQRSPILRRPDELGMEYQDIFFPALDGVNLEGWFIPTMSSSNKLVICNHFMPGNRYGFAGHLPQYSGFGGFEVNFLPHYKALHDAGYNILCYDLRNHGLSPDTNGRTITFGVNELRDVVGSIKYANSRTDTKGMEKYLLSICLGGNSTLFAMKKYPEYFDDIKAMVLLQPISMKCFVDQFIKRENLDYDAVLEFMEKKILEGSSFKLDDFSVVEVASGCKIPTKVLQVKKDILTDIQNVQDVFDNLTTDKKELFWIEDTEIRFQGYNYLGKEPKQMLDWFAKF